LAGSGFCFLLTAGFWLSFFWLFCVKKFLVLRSFPALGGICPFDVSGEPKQRWSFFDAGLPAKKRSVYTPCLSGIPPSTDGENFVVQVVSFFQNVKS